MTPPRTDLGGRNSSRTGETIKTSQVLSRRRPPPLEPGVIVDRRYEIERCVGEGGSGFVFRAYDRVLAQRVALKVLHAEHSGDKSWIKRLKREVRVAREIQHPNVCRVFDLGHADGHWFVTMEYAAAGSLRQVLDDRSAIFRPLKKVPVNDLAARFADAQAVCAGLAAIHSVGIVHRDITPGNVLRMEDGRLVITDFGLAIKAKDVTTFHGGTPRYMAPEVLQRKPADQRSDVWQLGYLLHEIVFQRHPDWMHIGDRLVLRSPAHEICTPAEKALAELCTECLSHNPDTRPKNAIEVAGRLTAAQHAQPGPPVTRLLRSAQRAARHPMARRVALVALVTLVFGVGVAATRARLRSPPPDVMVTRADAIWDPVQEDNVRKQFVLTLRSRPHAVDTFHLVQASIQNHLATWKATYRHATGATTVTRGPVVRCLEDDLDGVAALVFLLQSEENTETVVDGAPYAVAALRDPARCSGATETTAIPRPPSGTALRTTVDGLRRSLMFANPLIEGEHFATSAPVVQPLVAAAEKTGYCPVIAEALLAEAHAIGRAWTPDKRYRERLEDALWKAEQCGHDRIVAMAAAELAFADRFSPDSAKWSRMAESVMTRMGGDVRIESWLENNRAIAATSQGRYEEAIAGYQKAIALKRSEVGPDHLEYSTRLLNLSDALKGAGHLDEALQASDVGLAVMRRWLAPDHVDIAMVKSNRGDLLMALNRLEEAASAYREALAIFRARLKADDTRIGYPLAGLGMVLLEQGHPGARAILEKAVAFDFAGDDFLAAQVKFALARAITKDGGDEAEARSLARAADALYSKTDRFRAERDQIAHWIAARQSVSHVSRSSAPRQVPHR